MAVTCVLIPSIFSVDYAYEGVGKRTFLPMLLLFSFIFPLWLGLLILYPWIAGKRSCDMNKQSQEDEDEKTNLIMDEIRTSSD